MAPLQSLLKFCILFHIEHLPHFCSGYIIITYLNGITYFHCLSFNIHKAKKACFYFSKSWWQTQLAETFSADYGISNSLQCIGFPEELNYFVLSKPGQVGKKTPNFFSPKQMGGWEGRVFVWVWDSFCSSHVLNCTTVLDAFWTRKITSHRKCCNKECCLSPAYLSFLLMINHNSVLNYSGCQSAWQVTKVTVFKLANPQHGSSTDYSSKGQCKDPLQKDRMVTVGWYLWRLSSPTSLFKRQN